MASRLHRRYKRKYRRNPPEGGAPRRNPPLATDLLEWIGPGFAAFAASRLLTRLAATELAKRKPSLGKHAGAAAAVGSFLAAWFLANRWKAIAKYQMPLIVGSGLAALQSVVQLYLPKLGVLVADATPQIALRQQQARLSPRPEDLVAVDDDPNDYVYNDSFDAGRMDAQQTRADQTAPAQPTAAQEDDLSDLDLEEYGGQGVTSGIFAAN